MGLTVEEILYSLVKSINERFTLVDKLTLLVKENEELKKQKDDKEKEIKTEI